MSQELPKATWITRTGNNRTNNSENRTICCAHWRRNLAKAKGFRNIRPVLCGRHAVSISFGSLASLAERNRVFCVLFALVSMR